MQDTLKRNLSSDSGSTSEEDDTEDSETLTDENSDTPIKTIKAAGGLSDYGKKSQVDSSFKIIKLKDYNP